MTLTLETMSSICSVVKNTLFLTSSQVISKGLAVFHAAVWRSGRFCGKRLPSSETGWLAMGGPCRADLYLRTRIRLTGTP